MHFAIRFESSSFKNGTNDGDSPPSEFLIDFKSSEVGTLKTGSLQRSSVQPSTIIAFSESISNVNISSSFLHLRIIFDRLWERVVK